MIIRNAHSADIEATAKVHVDTWRSSCSEIVSKEYVDGLSYKKSEIAVRRFIELAVSQRTQSSKFSFVAEDEEGRIVGFASAGRQRQGEGSGVEEYDGELYGVYILKEQQRNGLGRKLVAKVAKKLESQGRRSMVVWVLDNNPAKDFYTTLGAKKVAKGNDIRAGEKLLKVAFVYENLQTLHQT